MRTITIRTKCVHCGEVLTVETRVSEPRLGPPLPTLQKALDLEDEQDEDVQSISENESCLRRIAQRREGSRRYVQTTL